MSTTRSDELVKLADDLAVTIDLSVRWAEAIFRSGWSIARVDNYPADLLRVVTLLGNSVQNVEELYGRLDVQENLRIISLVYSKCSESYSTNPKYEAAVRSRCFHRVLEHLLHFGDCAKDLIEDSKPTEPRLAPLSLSILDNKVLDNQSSNDETRIDDFIDLEFSDGDNEFDPLESPNHNSQVIASSNDDLDDDMVARTNIRNTPFTLWMRAGVLIEGSVTLGEHSPDFLDELSLCQKAIGFLKDFSHSAEAEEPTSAVLDVDDPISASLSGRRQQLYKRLARRRGHWVDFEYLVADVWNGDEIKPASIEREIRRMNKDIERFGWHGVYDEIDRSKRARLSRLPEEFNLPL